MRSPGVVLACLLLLGFAAPAHAVPPGWSLGGSVTDGRDWHTATRLHDGSVLITGGYVQGSFGTRTAERYYPATDTWVPTGPMVSVRRLHVAALLPNGKVLVAGGRTPAEADLKTGETYDPVTNSWSATGDMGLERSYATATTLPNGKVLIAGGSKGSARTATAELYDPANNAFTPTGSMSGGRDGATATALPNGNVLIIGGVNASTGGASNTVEVYNPVAGTFSGRAPMAAARYDHRSTLLPDGRVLVSGGRASGSNVATAEIYTPSTDKWAPAGSLNWARNLHASALLPNGRVLVAGGDTQLSNNGPDQTTEIYDPATNTWTPSGNMTAARHALTATPLLNGRVLIAGGYSGANGPTNYPKASELFTSATTLLADPAVSFDDLAPGAATSAVAHVTNTGDSPLLPGGFALAGSFPGDYSITGNTCAGAAVAPGQSCAVTLRFAPGGAGSRGATLTFEANTSALTHGISLIGRGVAGPSTPPPTVQPNTPQKIVVTLAYSFDKVTAKSTRLGSLVVKGVPAGAAVKVSCKKGCLKKSLTKRNVRGDVKLNGIVSAKRTVKVGTKIVVTVSAPGMVSAIKTLTVRKRKKPTVTTACQAPGQAKPSAC